ncbi:MAG: hypothetical protein ABI442_21805 [Gemmatimonadaceae bacterium]
MTANVIQSCVADTPRREALLSRVPFFVRPSMRPMLGIEGSSRFECFRSGKTTYFIAVATVDRKDDSHSAGNQSQRAPRW